MKKLLTAVGAFAGSVMAVMADESSSTSTIDLSGATTLLTDVKTQLVDWVGDALPLLTAIAGAFLVFWLGKMIFRLVKGWTSAAK